MKLGGYLNLLNSLAEAISTAAHSEIAVKDSEKEVRRMMGPLRFYAERCLLPALDKHGLILRKKRKDETNEWQDMI